MVSRRAQSDFPAATQREHTAVPGIESASTKNKKHSLGHNEFAVEWSGKDFSGTAVSMESLADIKVWCDWLWHAHQHPATITPEQRSLYWPWGDNKWTVDGSRPLTQTLTRQWRFMCRHGHKQRESRPSTSVKRRAKPFRDTQSLSCAPTSDLSVYRLR
jgi:hypothetical protein